ncbi:MAG: OmpA family protein [Ilumatobacter sp.]|uniref:OmpA family protein n=1 Tax=Ilumatobacter sp. TaxID=1967498 RepID=UPI003C73087F
MSNLPPPSSSTPVSSAAPAAVTSGGLFHNVMYTAIGLIAFTMLVFGGLQLTRGIDDGDGFSAIDTTSTTVALLGAEPEPIETALATVPSTTPVSDASVATVPPTSTTLPVVETTTAPAPVETVPVETVPLETVPLETVPPETSAGSDPDPDVVTTSDDDAGYPTLPDGSPVPVEAVYDGATVTLTGLVPSEAASVRLEALAVAGAPEPNTVATNLLEINENVPNTVAARVLSLDSVRFPEASAEITAEHAAELDGTVRTMESLANTTLLVIGHADQRGDDLTNLVLSDERADAMVFYLVSQGIDPSRLSSRGVGENDPISTQDNDAALQLNRRTELIFYGLLAV